MLLIKQSLQLLNAFSFGLEDNPVFHTRQGHKVNRSVVVLNPVEMMNYPSIRNQFPVGLLPYYHMLFYPTQRICPVVFGIFNHDVALFVGIPVFGVDYTRPTFTCQFHGTAPTSYCSICNELSTIQAKVPVFIHKSSVYQIPTTQPSRVIRSPHLCLTTSCALLATTTHQVATFGARAFMFLLPLSMIFCIITHSSIIPHLATLVKATPQFKAEIKAYLQEQLRRME